MSFLARLWPFVRRSTYEREVLVAKRFAGVDADSLIKQRDDAIVRANEAELAAKVAEAQLRQLGEPLAEVTRRMSALGMLTRGIGNERYRLEICVDYDRQMFAAFRDHPRALGWATAKLVQGAIALQMQHDSGRPRQIHTEHKEAS